MRIISNEEFNKALSQADERTKILMNSDYLYQSLEENILIRNLPDSITVESLLIPFGDFLLKLRSKDELTNILKESGLEDSLNFISAVEVSLNSKTINRDNTYEGIDNEPTENNDDWADEIAQTEAALSQISGDQHAPGSQDPVYTSTQAAILAESRNYQPAQTPLPPLPPTTPLNPPPRWGTDQ